MISDVMLNEIKIHSCIPTYPGSSVLPMHCMEGKAAYSYRTIVKQENNRLTRSLVFVFLYIASDHYHHLLLLHRN